MSNVPFPMKKPGDNCARFFKLTPGPLRECSCVKTLQIYYKHDEAPLYCTWIITHYRNEQFSEWWISHGSLQNLPPWSLSQSATFLCMGLHEKHGVWMQGGHKWWTTLANFFMLQDTLMTPQFFIRLHFPQSS